MKPSARREPGNSRGSQPSRPRQGHESSMLTITITDSLSGKEASVEIPSEHGPALRSAITEHRNELGERAVGVYLYDREASITRAITALGRLASIVNEIIPTEDVHYA